MQFPWRQKRQIWKEIGLLQIFLYSIDTTASIDYVCCSFHSPSWVCTVPFLHGLPAAEEKALLPGTHRDCTKTCSRKSEHTHTMKTFYFPIVISHQMYSWLNQDQRGSDVQGHPIWIKISYKEVYFILS